MEAQLHLSLNPSEVPREAVLAQGYQMLNILWLAQGSFVKCSS